MAKRPIPAKYKEPARRDQMVCVRPDCGLGVWWSGRGTRPDLCQVHGRPSRAKNSRSLRPLLLNEPSSSSTRARRRDAERESRMLSGREEYAVMRMAVGLGVYPDDPRRAAQYAQVLIYDGGPDTPGRVPSDDELEALLARAQGDLLADLREANDRGVAMVLRRFMAQASIELLEKLPMLEGKELAFAVTATQKTIEALGGRRVQYPHISINFGSEVEDEPPE